MPFKLSDGTQYERMSDGSWRRDPPKLGGRERKRLRKLRRRGHHKA
jgi:hypothetical protein